MSRISIFDMPLPSFLFQVHGYDLTCLSCLPGGRFVSGAEEKIARVFQVTANFVENYQGKKKYVGDEAWIPEYSVPKKT